jgi:hypothetical protein
MSTLIHWGMSRKQSPANSTTTAPVQSGDCAGQQAEFGRCADVTRLYGIKRGCMYALLADGKIKGVLLRVRGNKSGIRLIDLASVRQYIRHCQEQEAA